MEKSSSFIHLAASSIRIFADDGTIDMNELNYLLDTALADKEIDADEKRVLADIFNRVPEHADEKVKTKIAEIRQKYNI